MKKILLIFIFILCINFNNVYADTCDNSRVKKLTEIASNVKVSYEVETKTVENANYSVDGGNKTVSVNNIIIDIYNITDDIFIIISNNANSDKKTITYADTENGKYKLDTYSVANLVVTYTLDIYAKNEPCKPRKLKTITYVKPVENVLHYTDECKENLDIPFCAQFVTEKITGVNVFDMKSEVDNYRKTSTNKTTTNKEDNIINNDVTKFITNNKYYFIGGGTLIIGIITVVVIKKRRNQI